MKKSRPSMKPGAIRSRAYFAREREREARGEPSRHADAVERLHRHPNAMRPDQVAKALGEYAAVPDTGAAPVAVVAFDPVAESPCDPAADAELIDRCPVAAAAASQNTDDALIDYFKRHGQLG